MHDALEKLGRKLDRPVPLGELLKLLGFAVVFASVMVLTAWASGLPIAGR
jgi:hypothetical protein